MEIVKYPDPILREKSEKIKDPTSAEVKQLVSDMTKTLRANHGVGLSAPQIGKNIQLCLIEIEDELFVLINPKIKSVSDEKTVGEEGCLSFPGKFMQIQRSKRVKVKALDASGKSQVIRARGLFARALQHEIDHLDGILFIDRATDDNDPE